jgi:hypothetical protein
VRGFERRPILGGETDRTDVVARFAYLAAQGGIAGYTWV